VHDANLLKLNYLFDLLEYSFPLELFALLSKLMAAKMTTLLPK